MILNIGNREYRAEDSDDEKIEFTQIHALRNFDETIKEGLVF